MVGNAGSGGTVDAGCADAVGGSAVLRSPARENESCSAGSARPLRPPLPLTPTPVTYAASASRPPRLGCGRPRGWGRRGVPRQPAAAPG